eukprot:CAMPEP_0116139686 /NCGR_PEP_ID=MMETSP0329-20121206/13444_1 /TAXON_ID=697910 /ORGANISM="Pseudo-nitzschia arenysensis, Strain B593" /LENGTH=1924 /DNA_ID=CAMNT_0003634745 /DNA_START=165 /DNA_END=5939 /DNA_ORIENTATION=+
MSSPSRDPEDAATGEEAEEVIVMDTTDAEDTEEMSIWEVARQNSSKMVLASVMDDMEDRAAKQKDELIQLRRRAEDAEASLAASKQSTEQLEANLLQESNSKKELESKLREADQQTSVLKESIGNEKERADRSGAESDRLREEISRLTKSNESYQKQLAEAEAQAKLGDSSLLPLQFKNQRLETENDNLRTHSSWLEGELREKSEELSRLKSSTALESAQARANVEAARSERDEVTIENKQLREQLERIERKKEAMSRQLLDAKQEVSDVRLDSEKELAASRGMVDLKKEEVLRLQQRLNGQTKQIESMKIMATEAESDDMAQWQEREQELKEASKRILQEKTQEYENRLVAVQKELENANSRRKQAEDGLLAIEGPPATTGSPLTALPPSTNDENVSLTELYGRIAQAEDARDAEVILRKKAEIRFARLVAEVEANAPIILRKQKEYEFANKNIKDLQTRAEEAMDEAMACRNESNDLQKKVTDLTAEKKVLAEEGKALAQQVRDMLMARSSGVNNPNVPETVSQMVLANQRLLKDFTEMKAKKEDLEARLNQEDLQKEIHEREAEVEAMMADRKRQEDLVEKIVQQRDLYRTLLNKHDSNLLGSGEETSALAIVKGQSERTKALNEKYRQLTKDHGEALARLDVMTRDQEAASERLLRYEMLNGELTKSIDSANLEISKSKAAVARSEAEAVYYKGKAQMLEDAQQRNREEVKNVTASKNRIMMLNSDLEQSISKANSECAKMQDEFRQAKSKLLLAEAEAESAKAAEKRISDESTQLRNELSRQGGVLDGVQRIESTLLLKFNTDIESYKIEITSLKEKLASAEKKGETALEDLKGKVADQELQLKQLENSRATASKEALDSKKESLVAIKKADALTKKSSLLERQLTAAKKKLGETDGINEKDVESELRAKLESLTVDLEGAKKEAETWKTRAATYEKLSKDNEAAVSDMTEASNAAKKSLEENILQLKSRLEHSDGEMVKRKEIIIELTNDLSAQREERDKAVNEIKQQIAGFKADAEMHEKKAEDVESRFAQLQKDIGVLQSDLLEAQSNYERELALHSAVRTDLRTAREESEQANRLRNDAMEEAATLQSKFKVQESALDAEKSKRGEIQQDYEKKLESSRAENTLLHTQLEKINEQIQKMQSRSASDSVEADVTPEEVSADETMMKLRMDVTELRELVKFVRAEKDATQGQLESAKRSIERERTKVSVARRAAEETEAELKTLKESVANTSMNVTEGGTSMADKLKASEEQSRLLGDSNAHLSQQVQELQKNLSNALKELNEAKGALQPAADAKKELEGDKAALLAEKESLLREIDDWKGRVQSLVSKFNQVDPAEHAQVVKKAEDLEKEVKALEEKKVSAEEETKRIRTLASRASTQLSQNKQTVENQKKAIAKLTTEKAALVKAQKESSSKKDMDELKTKITELEKQKESEAIQLKGSTQMNDKLRNHLRKFQINIQELKKEKESLTKQLAESQSKAKTKEAEAAKAVATLKEKETTLAKTAAPTPMETSTKSVPAQEKPAAAVPKESVASPAAPPTEAKPTTEKKEGKKVMPKVPAGGFKFAPSKTSAVSAVAAKKTEPEKKEAATVSKKRPAADLEKQEAPAQKKPATGAPSPGEKGESSPSPKRPQAPIRRKSTEVKEMSLKEKLLEKKKRKLAELKKAKEAAEQARSNSPTKADSSGDGKVAEKKSPLNVKAPAFVPNPFALKKAAAEMAAKSPKADTTNEDGEMKESEDKVGEAPTIGSASTGSVFGGGSKAPTSFGVFGSGSTSTFGKPSGFGSGGSVFGSSAASAGKSSFGFGAAKPAEGGSASGSTSSGFGSPAFLNIKPPGSSTGATPQFSFGSSGSAIKLPTPGAPTPASKMNVFGGFSSPAATQSFGGQASIKPLFGSIPEKKEDEKEDGEAEDGEMPDTSTK